MNELAQEILRNNIEKGFWEQDRNIGELLMLVVSELSEALECDRKGLKANVSEYSRTLELYPDDPVHFKTQFQTYMKDTFQDEIADSIIRLLDISAGLGIDIEFHIREKMKYNKLREYKHGKKY